MERFGAVEHMKQDRRDMIKASAERARQSKRQPMKAEPKSRAKRSNGTTVAPEPRQQTKPGPVKGEPKDAPKRIRGRWQRTGSKTVTVYNISLADAYDLIRGALEANEDRNEPIGREKVHLQLFCWERLL